jgi:hypothetical protein
VPAESPLALVFYTESWHQPDEKPDLFDFEKLLAGFDLPVGKNVVSLPRFFEASRVMGN